MMHQSSSEWVIKLFLHFDWHVLQAPDEAKEVEEKERHMETKNDERDTVMETKNDDNPVNEPGRTDVADDAKREQEQPTIASSLEQLP